MEFFLNKFHWMQWTMTKSKKCTVNTDTTYLDTVSALISAARADIYTTPPPSRLISATYPVCEVHLYTFLQPHYVTNWRVHNCMYKWHRNAQKWVHPVTFPVIVIQGTFLLPLSRHLLPLTTLNRYLDTRGCKRNFILITQSKNIFNQTWDVLPSFSLLDFDTIHWFQWIQHKLFAGGAQLVQSLNFHLLIMLFKQCI